jgi:hypothetical protein
VSLADARVTVTNGGVVTLRLTCTGSGTCSGTLDLAARRATKKGRAVKSATIATGRFSVTAGKTATVKLPLNGLGRGLLRADHERMNATLIVVKRSPSPSQTRSTRVRLVEQQLRG